MKIFQFTRRARLDLLYLIFYQKPAGHVQIIRIFHGRRDLKSFFRKRDS